MKRLFSVLLVLAFSLTATATARSIAENAVRKLEDTVYYNVPAEHRQPMQRQVDMIRRSLGELGHALERLDGYTNYELPEQYRRVVNQRIREVKFAIGADLTGNNNPPGEEGFYCAAACKNYTGNADWNYGAGGTAKSRIVAQQLALDNLKKAYNCNYGPAELGCEATSWNNKAHTCQYACNNYTGVPDKAYGAIGQGGSKLEASLNAIAAVKAKYNCNYGVGKVVCE